MSIEKICTAMRERLTNYLTASAVTTSAIAAGTNPAIIPVNAIGYFDKIAAMRNYPQANIFDTVGGSTIPIGYVKIKDFDSANNTLTLSTPTDFNIPLGATIKFAPNWTEVQDVRLGDPSVLSAYPTVCIEPSSKAMTWQILQGETESVSLSIFVHVLDDNSQNAVLTLARITEDIEDLIHTEFHLVLPMDRGDQYNRVYDSKIENVNYGFSNKGAFLRSSKFDWSAKMLWMRVADPGPIFP